MQSEKYAIAEIAVFFLLSFYASLRGFELPKIVLAKLVRQMQLEDQDNILAHLGIPLHGKFKSCSSYVVELISTSLPQHIRAWSLGSGSQGSYLFSRILESPKGGYSRTKIALLRR